MDPTGQDIRFMEMKDAINKLNNNGCKGTRVLADGQRA
jgi:hypothetical protein